MAEGWGCALDPGPVSVLTELRQEGVSQKPSPSLTGQIPPKSPTAKINEGGSGAPWTCRWSPPSLRLAS